MKRLRHLASSLIQRLRQRLKTWPSSNTEASSKSSKARFKAGDEVKVVYLWTHRERQRQRQVRYAGMEGVVLEVANHSSHLLVYQVSIDIDGFEHIQYFGEGELDYTRQRKRDDRLKELGI